MYLMQAEKLAGFYHIPSATRESYRLKAAPANTMLHARPSLVW